MGRYLDAENLYHEAKKNSKGFLEFDSLPEEHAIVLYNLGNLYTFMGSYEDAEPLYNQCLSIREKELGKKHIDYCSTLQSLAYLYHLMEEYKKSEELSIYTSSKNIRSNCYKKRI